MAPASTAPTLEDARQIALGVARRDARVGRVMVFGSVARGDADANSDLDFVIVLSDDFGGDRGEAALSARTEIRRRCAWSCDVVVRTQQEWEHLTANVSASFEAAIAAEATELFSRPGCRSRQSDVTVSGVAQDNLDVAASRLQGATGELASIEKLVRAIPDEEREIPQSVEHGETTEDLERRQRYLGLLADAHLAIELAIKSVIAAEGRPPRYSHDIHEHISDVRHSPTRAALEADVSEAREPDGRMRIWRVGVYESDDPEWQASINAANTADHIAAAVATARTAADFLHDRSSRDEHRAAAARIRTRARRLSELNITESSLTTGAGLPGK